MCACPKRSPKLYHTAANENYQSKFKERKEGEKNPISTTVPA